jgi:hypothetical protein
MVIACPLLKKGKGSNAGITARGSFATTKL